MTVNKFGRYLDKSNVKTSKLASLKVMKHQIDVENRLLRNVNRGILKHDVVVKAQLDEVLNLCLLKIKSISKTVEEIRKVQNEHPSKHPSLDTGNLKKDTTPLLNTGKSKKDSTTIKKTQRPQKS